MVRTNVVLRAAAADGLAAWRAARSVDVRRSEAIKAVDKMKEMRR